MIARRITKRQWFEYWMIIIAALVALAIILGGCWFALVQSVFDWQITFTVWAALYGTLGIIYFGITFLACWTRDRRRELGLLHDVPHFDDLDD